MIVYEHNYFVFRIFIHYIEWSQARIIWIAFHKNRENKKCLIANLPKDVVNHVFDFLGPCKTPKLKTNALFL